MEVGVGALPSVALPAACRDCAKALWGYLVHVHGRSAGCAVDYSGVQPAIVEAIMKQVSLSGDDDFLISGLLLLVVELWKCMDTPRPPAFDLGAVYLSAGAIPVWPASRHACMPAVYSLAS